MRHGIRILQTEHLKAKVALISGEIGVAVIVPLRWCSSESQISCCSFVLSFRQMRGFLVESTPPTTPTGSRDRPLKICFGETMRAFEMRGRDDILRLA